MRRVVRAALDRRTIRYLEKRQLKINNISSGAIFCATAEWKKSRSTKGLLAVLSSLNRMMGESQRCMYCHDSHGSDIEHFWPKTPYPNKMFLWDNMLLCCTECGRAKGDVFPLAGGMPLIVDPTVEEPWSYIDFDPDIGVLVPTFDSTANAPSPKGETTVTVLKLDRREALQSVYLRTWRRLCNVVGAIQRREITPDDAFANFVQDDDHGLIGWCITGTGKTVEPFQTLWAERPDVWEACKAEYEAQFAV